MSIADRKEQIRNQANVLADDIARYQAAAKEIRESLEAEELRPILTPMDGASVDWSALKPRARRRISQMLGAETRARLEADGDDPRTGFSLETYVQTVLPREDVAEEARAAAADLAYALEVETDPGILALEARDFVEQATPGEEVLSRAGNHQAFLDQLFAALAVQSVELDRESRRLVNAVLRKRSAQSELIRKRIEPHWRRLMHSLRPVAGPEQDRTTERRTPRRAERRPPQQPEDLSMAQASDNDCCERIVDALSRLQGSESGGGIAGATAAEIATPDFSKTLDQQIYASIGFPNLRSEAAQGMGKGALAEKLILGLDRSVLRETTEIGTHFLFNPTQARAVAPLGGGMALGAQGVVAETVSTLQPAILRCLRRLKPEVCNCSQGEVDDLIVDIERGLDLLASESRAASGIFQVWANTLLGRIVADVVELIRIYGIRLDIPAAAAALIALRIREIQIVDEGPVVHDPAVVNRDVGFLSREANDQAIRTVFEHIATIAQLIKDLERMPRGLLMVRLRAVVEAIPPAVADARSALSLAGVSETDRAAEYLRGDEDPFGIELTRLLDLTETTANEWRVRLLEEDLNKRDVGWLRQTLQTLSTAFENVDLERDGGLRISTINRNRFAMGARQLRELADHVETARRITERLYEEIDDRGPRPRELRG